MVKLPIIFLSLVWAVSAIAQDAPVPAQMEIRNSEGRVELAIITRAEIAYSAALESGRLHIEFDQPISGDFQLPVVSAGEFFKAAHHQDETAFLDYTVDPSLTLNHAQSSNIITVELLADAQSEDVTIDISAAFYDLFVRPPAQEARPEYEFQNFVEEEVALLFAATTAAPSEQDVAMEAVLRFYISHSLYPELYSFIQGSPTDGDSAYGGLIEAVALYRLGRYEGVIQFFDNGSDRQVDAAKTLRAMAQAQVGAYQAAGAVMFSNQLSSAFPFKNEYYLLKAETALAQGEPAIATPALAAILEETLGQSDRQRISLLRALVGSKTGQDKRAASTMRALSKSALVPINIEAAIYLAYSYGVQDAGAAAGAIAEINQLLLNWRGGRTERIGLHQIALLADVSDDLPFRMDAWQRIYDQYPSADIAEEAERSLRDGLFELVAEKNVAPMEAARLFYQTISFAPPGRAGDDLIIKVTEDLVALDLLDEAAELLEHQTFERSRGSRRSEMASRLAKVYLRNDKAGDALRVIRSTRLARLPDALNNERALLEAQALIEIGESETALTILDNTTNNSGERLRGEIYWAAEEWEKAGDAFRASVTAQGEDSFDRRDSLILLRAAAAYMQADNEDKLSAITETAGEKLYNPAANAFLQELAVGDFGVTAPDYLDNYFLIFAADA